MIRDVVIDPEAVVMTGNIEGDTARGVQVHEITVVGKEVRAMNTEGGTSTMRGRTTATESPRLRRDVTKKIIVARGRDPLDQKALDSKAARLLRRRQDTTTWVPIDNCWSERDRN